MGRRDLAGIYQSPIIIGYETGVICEKDEYEEQAAGCRYGYP